MLKYVKAFAHDKLDLALVNFNILVTFNKSLLLRVNFLKLLRDAFSFNFRIILSLLIIRNKKCII